MSRFKEVFEAYGAEYEVTMERFMGNEAMYLRVLGMLFKDESLHKLGSALDSGDLTAAFDAAHTLKGVSSNLGLTPLYSAVCAIVEPLRARDEHADYPALHQTIHTEFQNAERFREALEGAERL